MNKRVKKKWLKALRSGEYKQGQGTLCRADGSEMRFCCLGVLLDIEGDGRWFKDRNSAHFYEDKDGSCVGGAPTMEFIKRIKLEEWDMDTLMSKNDSGESFEEIAYWIEKNL